MQLSPCQLGHPPTSSQGPGSHHPDTCPVLQAVRTLERTCHIGCKCSQLVGCRKHLQRPRQAGEHDTLLQHPVPQEGPAVLLLPVWLPKYLQSLSAPWWEVAGPSSRPGLPRALGWAVAVTSKVLARPVHAISSTGISMELRDLV